MAYLNQIIPKDYDINYKIKLYILLICLFAGICCFSCDKEESNKDFDQNNSILENNVEDKIQEKVINKNLGKIVSVEFEKIILKNEIDKYIKPLFEGYNSPKAKYDVAIFWIVYESLYPDGEIALITSQVFVPQYKENENRSIYVFGSGSTGLRDSCRPSREHIAGIRWGLYRSHVLAHSGQGSIGVMPDYMGFGDPNRYQYYMVAQCEARVMLDSIRAIKNLIIKNEISGINKTYHFIAGFSQGGHAAYAAADYREEYASEIELHGVIGYGPSTNLFSLLKEYPDLTFAGINRLLSETHALDRRRQGVAYASDLHPGLLGTPVSRCFGAAPASRTLRGT